ncbi:MAG TPA: DUF2249 domain-containing protein [Gemmatimonadales bacterium]|nr:DUF2249 domain-containing protein [Gemmatimonadales bacterium]
MVIRKSDSVAAVLRQDESLIEVFIGLSPAFERLRNPAMRKVMSRLVTVEQAARMAGVDGDELVRRLNGVVQVVEPVGTELSETAEPEPPAPPAGLAAALRGLAVERVVEIDVREDLRAGKEPFSRIMAARQQVPEGGVLSLRAIFEPVPLYAVMAKQGFDHYTERLGDEDWRVWFYPAGTPPRSAAAERQASKSSSAAATPREGDLTGAWDVVVLDVRDLEPPEPMVRTLAALEQLPRGATLVQLNVRVPEFLLPRLEERGFTYDIRPQGPDLVRVFIRHAVAG